VIHVVLGTKAQLIKMAPILVRLEQRGIPHRFIHTGQHQATMDAMLAEFGLRPPDVVLHTGRDVVSLPQMAWWTAKILARCVGARRRVFGEDASGIVLVHGDTFSTLLGALMGRVAGLVVGHVESGLRSFDLFHPFPEELTRLATFRLSQVLYCPGPGPAANVAKLGREVVDTGTNTMADTLALALAAERRTDHVPRGRFGIASLHRYENVFQRARFERMVGWLEEIAAECPLLFVLHPPTARQLDRFGLRERLERNPAISLFPRQTYFDFVTLLERAAFIVTDGGSIQEESSYLGLPCLLLRKTSEREEGLGGNVVLSGYDDETIRRFAREPEIWRRPRALPEQHPSDLILENALCHAR